MEKDRRPIVVGVTGPGENDAALRFAADEAHRLGVGVCLAHAVREVSAPAVASPLEALELPWEELGDRIVAESLDHFRSLYGDLEATVLARPGRPVKVLTELSIGARMVVLQHRDLSSLRRVFTGSTVTGVAANAECPVTSVPAGWTPSEKQGRVTVGLHEDGLPTPVLAQAYAEAAAAGWSLRVARAWKLDPMYEGVIVTDYEQWRHKVESVVRSAIEQLSPEHPDVPVEIEVRHQWPADLLVELSATSSLLIVGRHSHQGFVPHQIGSIARALLRSATCPVMVVPV
jgi:nucleotide-binding universal stress UspA family protein